jgi:hypothetical protein
LAEESSTIIISSVGRGRESKPFPQGRGANKKKEDGRKEGRGEERE